MWLLELLLIVFILKMAFMVGLQSSQVMICVWNLLSKRRVCVYFGKKYGILMSGFRFSFKNEAELEKCTYLAFNSLITTVCPSSLDAES